MTAQGEVAVPPGRHGRISALIRMTWTGVGGESARIWVPVMPHFMHILELYENVRVHW